MKILSCSPYDRTEIPGMQKTAERHNIFISLERKRIRENGHAGTYVTILYSYLAGEYVMIDITHL